MVLGLGDRAGGWKRGGVGRGGGGELKTTSWMARKITNYYSSRLMSGVVHNTICRCGIQCVIASWCVLVNGSQDKNFNR